MSAEETKDQQLVDDNAKRLADCGFAGERTDTFKSFDKAIAGLKTYLIKSETVDPSKVQFTFNGTANFKIDDKSHKTTEWGVSSVCKMLRIPNPFVRAIPLDLVQQNINRLLQSVGTTINVNYDINDNVVGFTPSKYTPIQAIDLLPRLKDKLDGTSENVAITLSTRNTVVKFTSSRFVDLVPKPGDITKCGMEIVNSELNDMDTRANMFLLRLVCTNGATLTEHWGSVKRNRSAKLQYESMIEQFVGGCSKLDTNMVKLTQTYSNLAKTSLDSQQFVAVYKALAPMLGKEAAADVLDSDIDDVKDLVAFEGKRTRWSAAPSDEYGKNPRDTEKNCYEVFNKITELARDFTNVTAARKLRVFSGRYLWMLTEK